MRRFPLVLLLILTFAYVPQARAIDVTANDTASLIAAINAVNVDGTHTITLLNDIQLTAPLPDIGVPALPGPDAAPNITIDGGGFTLTAPPNNRVFTIVDDTVTIRNMTLTGGVADLGGCLRVDGTTVLSMEDVTISECRATEEGGGGAYLATDGRLLLNRLIVENNISETDGGGLKIFGGTPDSVIANSIIRGNRAETEGSAMRFADATLRIEDTRIENNIAGEEAAIIVTFIGISDVTLSGVRMFNNRGESSGIGGVVATELSGTVTVNNSCFFNNGISYFVPATIGPSPQNARDNWWGAPSGPDGFGEPIDDDFSLVDVSDRKLVAPPDCPTIPFEAVPDYYAARVGQALVVDNPAEGVIGNDLNLVGVEPANEASYPSARGGTVQMNTDGTFIYTPPSTAGIDAFEYRGTDGGQGRSFGLVCVSVSDLSVETPPPQNADSGRETPIPDVQVESSTPDSSIVKVTLRAGNGVLNVDVPDNAGGENPLIDRCDPGLFGTLDTTQSAPSVVSSFGGGGKLAPSSMSAPYEVLAQANVGVRGNSTPVLTLSGPKGEVNTVLRTLTYTSNAGFRGVDQIVVIAEEGGAQAIGNVVIIVGGADDDGAPDVRDLAEFSVPDEPVLLRDLSVQPGTFIRGTILEGAVPNGDVFVRVLARDGAVLVRNPAEIGELAVFQGQIEHGAEIFGLTFGGVSVPGFNAGVTVCLLGNGTFYFRDATGVPRTTVQLPTFPDGAFTCSIIPNSGTVILVREGGDVPAVVTGGGEGVRVELADCMVTTNNILNLRAGPSMNAEILRPIPFNVTLTAIAEQDTWYEVDYLGLFGWVSADFVETSGTCG